MWDSGCQATWKYKYWRDAIRAGVQKYILYEITERGGGGSVDFGWGIADSGGFLRLFWKESWGTGAMDRLTLQDLACWPHGLLRGLQDKRGPPAPHGPAAAGAEQSRCPRSVPGAAGLVWLVWLVWFPSPSLCSVCRPRSAHPAPAPRLPRLLPARGPRRWILSLRSAAWLHGQGLTPLALDF